MNENTLGYVRRRYGKNPFPWIYLLIGLVATVTVGSMGYIFYIGNSMVAGYAPLIHATMGIKLGVTMANLSFEQVMNSDHHEVTVDDALKQIDHVDRYTLAMLEGGKINEHTFVALRTPHLRQEITDVRNKLAGFRVITIERWKTGNAAGIGTYVSQQYHMLFKLLVDRTNHVETELRRQIELDLRSFRTVQLILIGICLSVTAFVATAFGRFVHRRTRDEQRLRDMISQLTMAEDRERRNIAGLLHDDVMQRLVLSKMKMGELREAMTSSSQIESLEDIRDQISGMLKGMRSLTLDLCPALLYDIGLEAALRDCLYREVAGTQGLAVDFETTGRPLQLDEDLRVALYRAAREVLINVVKHSHARKASITIDSLSDMVEIEIIDDGAGFEIAKIDEKQTTSGGLGLFVIRERLEHFGGSLKIESKPGKGSRVTLTVPLTSRKEPVKETAE